MRAARLADMLGALSLVTDLAAGAPVETSLRTCVLATTLARRAGVDGDALADVYYTALLRHLGCTAFAHEAAHLAAGDDHRFLQTFEEIEPTDRAATAARAVRSLAKGAGARARVTAVARVLTAPATAARLAHAQCAQATALASAIGMSASVGRALGQIWARFDGSGVGPRGHAIELAARWLHVATTVEIHHRHGGRARAEAIAQERAGTQLDPEMTRVFLTERDAVWSILEASIWDAYLDAEPGAPRTLDPAEAERIARAFGDFADLKVPSRLGHSPAVARLAQDAAAARGMAPEEIASLRLAALLHDIGIAGVPNGIWEKRGPLDLAEWERVRLHAYYTHRILSRVPFFEPMAAMAVLHHERCDGSGYPRGARVDEAQAGARLLAAADAFTAMTEPRLHRAALSEREAARILRDDARAGALCATSVDCVLAAAGQAKAPPLDPSFTLTAREIEVLVALVRGSTNKEIGVALGISAKTVQHHLAHAYAKIGVSTRSAAALFAARHDLAARVPRVKA